MRHYGITKKFLKEQHKEALKECAWRLLNIHDHITNLHGQEYHDQTKKNRSKKKSELVNYCYYMIDDIMEAKMGSGSKFFWYDGGTYFGEKYLRDTIKDIDDELFYDFIHEDDLKPFWENEIRIYRFENIRSALRQSQRPVSLRSVLEKERGQKPTFSSKYKIDPQEGGGWIIPPLLIGVGFPLNRDDDMILRLWKGYKRSYGKAEFFDDDDDILFPMNKKGTV